MASTLSREPQVESGPRSFATWAPHAFLTLIYCLTHGLGLLNRGLFWDDWVFWQQNKQLVAQTSRDMGSVWSTDINNWIFYSQAGITLGRVLSFAALLAATLLLFGIVRRLPRVTTATALWVAVFFALYPGFTSREALVMTAYSLCLAFFLGAVWLLVRFSPKPKIWVRIASAALLLLSYHTRSLLVLSGFLPVILLMVDPPASRRPRDVAGRLLRYADQFVLPFVFYVATKLWFEPKGLYAGYNEIMAGKIQVGQVLWSGVVNTIPFSLVWTSVNPDLKAFVVAAIVFVPLALLAWRRWSLEHSEGDLWMFDAGVVLVVLAVFPYAMVDKVPTFSAFETRHQLLVPIGWGTALVAFAKGHARSPKIARALVGITISLVVAYFAATHIQSYLGYQREWLKQEALMEAFSRSPEIRSSKTVLFIDQTLDWNAGHRASSRQHYEYSGMMAEVFGDQSRFGIERSHYRYIPYDVPGGFKTLENNEYYKLRDWTMHDPDYIVRIEEGKLDLSSAGTVLRLTVLDWTDRPALRKKLAQAVKLRAVSWSWRPGQPLMNYRIPPQYPER